MLFSTPVQIHTLHYEPQSRVPWVLRAGALCYGVVVRVRQALYAWGLLKTARLGVPVISIGNLTTGGTGKTPVVIALCQFLETRGLRVAVLSRGYGVKVPPQGHEATGPEWGDEPWLIQQNLKQGKVFVGSNRVRVGRQVVQGFQPDVILLDDGFQHLRLHRDLNILLVDGQHGFGNGHLLPAGPLREPLGAIDRANVVFLTKQATPEVQDHFLSVCQALQLPVSLCLFAPVSLYRPATQENEPLAELAHRDCILLSGIAQPGDFEVMARETLSVKVVHHWIRSDHAAYPPAACQQLLDLLIQNPKAALLTTEKDWVKLEGLLPSDILARVYVLKIAPMLDWAPWLTGLSLGEAAHAD